MATDPCLEPPRRCSRVSNLSSTLSVPSSDSDTLLAIWLLVPGVRACAVGIRLLCLWICRPRVLLELCTPATSPAPRLSRLELSPARGESDSEVKKIWIKILLKLIVLSSHLVAWPFGRDFLALSKCFDWRKTGRGWDWWGRQCRVQGTTPCSPDLVSQELYSNCQVNFIYFMMIFKIPGGSLENCEKWDNWVFRVFLWCLDDEELFAFRKVL